MPVKKLYRPILPIFLALLAVTASGRGQTSDAVLTHYWRKASEVYERRRNADSTVQYQLTAQSFYKALDRKGEVTRVDTALATYYYSGAHLDSTVFEKGDHDRFAYVDLAPPNVFLSPYLINLFPNDDGISDLAIGLDTEVSDRTTPTGLLLMDRRSYLPRLLYLYHHPEGEFVRFTRSYRFFVFNGLVVADSSWVVASKHGILFQEYFRIETGVTDIVITK